MTQTRPNTDQVRFTSSNTGDQILDTYLEAAERGGRALADLMADLFDGSGNFNASLFEFRVDSNELQFRAGSFVDPEAGWSSLTNIFKPVGDFVANVTYNNLELISDTTDLWFFVGESEQFADITAFRASSKTTLAIQGNGASSTYRDEAQAARDAAIAAQTAAEAAEAGAETAETGAQAAETGALAAQAAAESARDTILTDTGFIAVNGALTNINTVATNIANVNTVAGISTDVTTVTTMAANISAVLAIQANINTVAAAATNITTVATDITNVNTVATNMTTIQNVSDNIAIIQANDPLADAIGMSIVFS